METVSIQTTRKYVSSKWAKAEMDEIDFQDLY